MYVSIVNFQIDSEMFLITANDTRKHLSIETTKLLIFHLSQMEN